MLHSEGSWLHLWYVSHDGLAGASLNHSVSTNSGQTWSKPAKLPLAPLAAGKLLPGSPPVALADGGLGLPLSRSALGERSEWLRLSATGKILAKQRLPQSAASLQPALVILDVQHALAFLRDGGTTPGKVRLAGTANGGESWQAAAPLSIANNNTPLAALRLPSGRLLLAGNPESGRASLRLWLSADSGSNWQPSRVIEEAADGAADFSQPALLLGRDGRIHLAYRWRQQGIRLLSFNEAWMDGGAP
jgi:predicted neuraminidase